jgi:Xaa-Pro aminopeptidase
MRQTYEIQGGAELGRANLPMLRAELARAGVGGLYLPHDDEYLNEYLPEANERLAWATGFTGSAGAALIFAKSAVVFVDGRYTLQAGQQLDARLFETVDLADPGPWTWLSRQSLAGEVIGYDPHTISPDALQRLAEAADKAGAKVKAIANPVDAAWKNRPPEPARPVLGRSLEHAGEPSPDKRARIGKAIAEQGADATVLTSPATLAWLFNIRGGDVACTPLPLGRAILFADGTAELFLRPDKAPPELGAHLGNEVSLRPISELSHRLAKLSGKTVSLDPSLASAWFFDTVEAAGARVIRAPDPCALPRARKNAAEIAGMRAAHVRDGAALARFLRWVDVFGATGEVSEIDAAKRLESLREETGELRDLSFFSISGAGPNGAVIHYRPSVATDRKLTPGSLYLIDSGGQYLDGTTDVTRTLAIGEPTPEMCDRYTRVLKGHIALSRVRFPKGTTGSALDALARLALWDIGLDYEHGTGHGVGCYLGVHEGPHRIAKAPNTVPLEPGMVVSNEPGYYKPGAFGIRIENLQVVTEPRDLPGGEKPMMCFETLTLAPLDRRLIITGLLSPEEWTWVDRYHARVLAEIGPRLDGEDRAWLETACRAL